MPPEQPVKKYTIHDALMVALQRIYRETRVVVKHIDAQWQDVSTLGGPDMRITAVSINSSYPVHFEPEEEEEPEQGDPET